MLKYLILIVLYQEALTKVGSFERHSEQQMSLRNLYTQEQLKHYIRNFRYPKYPVQLPYQIVNDAVRAISYVPQIFNYLVPAYKNSDLFVNAKYKEICPDFRDSLEQMDRTFYLVTHEDLVKKNLAYGRKNGISFIQSGILIYLSLLTLSTTSDWSVNNEINDVLQLNCNVQSKLQIIKTILSKLPKSDLYTKIRWSSRLVLATNLKLRDTLIKDYNLLRIDHLNDSADIVKTLNYMVQEDSMGSMRNDFDESDFIHGMKSALLSTMYFKSQWRVSPTLLNGTIPFYDGVPRDMLPKKFTRAIRINDKMGYVDLPEWDAEATEIQYATPGLSLIAIIPRGTSLMKLARQLGNSGVRYVVGKLRQRRISITMPIYTLRMTVLLSSKLRALGLSKFISENGLLNNTSSEKDRMENVFPLSHAFQPIMFWADAGRNAFKDDGILWDESPDQELLVDRPYIFFVRWKGLTLLSGNFVL